ncbi:uncharacterized protein LOC114229419 [Eptesicus fuscus]|uniref:uncharacterized protein LOC114229419 n=1 Tax=Eptesicus fuscus TaxID=29078 RepID=UPI0024044FD9|nr:uncharacterized protein LOC114229419 [Eptesicus fuscus]
MTFLAPGQNFPAWLTMFLGEVRSIRSFRGLDCGREERHGDRRAFLSPEGDAGGGSGPGGFPTNVNTRGGPKPGSQQRELRRRGGRHGAGREPLSARPALESEGLRFLHVTVGSLLAADGWRLVLGCILLEAVFPKLSARLRASGQRQPARRQLLWLEEEKRQGTDSKCKRGKARAAIPAKPQEDSPGPSPSSLLPKRPADTASRQEGSLSPIGLQRFVRGRRGSLRLETWTPRPIIWRMRLRPCLCHPTTKQAQPSTPQTPSVASRAFSVTRPGGEHGARFCSPLPASHSPSRQQRASPSKGAPGAPWSVNRGTT